MKKISSLFIIAVALCFMACGNKGGVLGGSDINLEAPDDPSGDIEKDAQAIADYFTSVMKVTEDAGKKIEQYNKKYEGQKEEYTAKMMSGEPMADMAKPDHNKLIDIPEPTGDLNKDAKTVGEATFRLISLAAEMEKNIDKYNSFYQQKGDGEYKKFEDALKKVLPADILKKLESGE